jgi:hypothetical protein
MESKMHKMLPIIAAFALAGCMEPPPPSPEFVRLQGACDAGDMNACGILANARAQQQAAYGQFIQGMQAQNNATMQANAQIFAAGTPRMAPPPMYIPPPPLPRQTFCQPGFTRGSLNCTTY